MAQLKKEIGLITLLSIGVGSVVGSGVFILPAVMGTLAGPAMVISTFLAGLIAAFMALSYAELGSAFPITGGP